MQPEIQGKLVFAVFLNVLEMLKNSGANANEALCALRAAEAMIPELDLPLKPTAVIET
jgi:hypothetical protein